jgi:hypothetical protein
MSEIPKKSKKAADSEKMEMIQSAIFTLENAHEFGDSPCFLDWLEPLIKALKDKDYRLISRAIYNRYSDIDHMKQSALKRAKHIAKNPEDYGMEKLSKTDVIEIMKVTFPYYLEFIPQSPRGLSAWWDEIGIPLGQGRGNIHPKLREWLKKRELSNAKKIPWPFVIKTKKQTE